MSVSYCLDFNLRFAGEEAEEFLTRAVRTWPPLWEGIPGVTGTLLLSNALALGGPLGYRWRVDFERLSDLVNADRALNSDDEETRRIVEHWFDGRSSAQASISQSIAGEANYNAYGGGAEGLIHCVFLHSERAHSQQHTKVGSETKGVLAFQSHQELLSPDARGYATWFRLAGLDHLDSVFAATSEFGSRTARLFGEVKEIDGNLFLGA
jgi:hypothetical protein